MIELEGERSAARPFPKLDEINNDPRPQINWLVAELLDIYDPHGPVDARLATLRELIGVCQMVFSLNKIRWTRFPRSTSSERPPAIGLDLSDEVRDEMAKLRKKPNGSPS